MEALTLLTMNVHSREDLKKYEFYYLLPLMYFVFCHKRERSIAK